ncbi:Dephospho-CoA kinase [Fulvivirga imtechensis AK7]|uniref:Dephospho-CoA kinase n=1 Tax=Fulvivirga imtechensis AK7 TaxID=1237149 RepID=L8JPC6_9BACT|nr:dephospho-CoA kinase [Fulvivirga imtechensis]ELR70695.1 Dephospho-CoA kinase [Fulvivirga imtechensis AK7]
MKNNTPLKVGVTGGIGSGKSLVCKIFSILSVPVYKADARAKWLTNNDPVIKERIVEKFGKEAYNFHGLDRDYIANIVFNDPEKLKILNSIVHPEVGKDYDRWVYDHNSAPYLINEAALMFESGSYKKLDSVINVSAPESLRIQRVLKRDPFRSEKEVKAIIAKQLPESERQERADYNIFNDEKQMLIPQVLGMHQKFLANKYL